MANIELINQLEDWVVEQDELREAGKPSEWDQDVWAKQSSCGTACCVAGKAVQLAGYQLNFNRTIGYSDELGTDPIFSAWEVKGGGLISDVARQVLDLTEVEAEFLFSESNDLEALQGYFNALRQGLPFEFDEDEVTEDWD